MTPQWYHPHTNITHKKFPWGNRPPRNLLAPLGKNGIKLSVKKPSLDLALTNQCRSQQYLHHDLQSGLKKTISKVLFVKTISQTPSPNHYNPNLLQLKKKEPSFTMQSKTISMHNLIAEQNNYKPSPVNYETIAKFKSSGSMYFLWITQNDRKVFEEIFCS